MYKNGVLVDSGVADSNYDHSNADTLRIARRQDGYSGVFGGDIALLRISATAPSPEQIRRIYEAERDFFQDNAPYSIPSVSDYTLNTPQKFWQLDDSTLNNRITLERDAGGNLQLVQSQDSRLYANIEFATLANGTNTKAGVAFNHAGISTVFNGGSVTTDTTVNVPNVNIFRIGSGLTDLNTSTYIRSIQYYPRKLTDEQIKDLTS
jgi:hypothetical protein